MQQKINALSKLSRRDFLGLSGRAAVSSIALGTGLGATLRFHEVEREKELPKTVKAATWNAVQKEQFLQRATRDWELVGPKAYGWRKWWEEKKEKENIKPQKYNLSCEFWCLEKLLEIKNVRNLTNGVEISEDSLISVVPINSNPLLGRPSNINGGRGKLPPEDYGIYAKALAGSVRNFLPNTVKLCATDSRDFKSSGQNMGQEYLERFLNFKQGGPFMFWFQCDTKDGLPYRYGEGELTTKVAAGEHCGICVAANKENILYIDPINAEMYRMTVGGDNGLIQRAWNVGFNMLGVEKD